VKILDRTLAVISPSPSVRRIATSAEESHSLNSVAPLATILNDVFTFSPSSTKRRGCAAATQAQPKVEGNDPRAKDSGLTLGEVRRGQYPSRRAATLNKSQSQPAIATTITIDNTVRLKRLRMSIARVPKMQTLRYLCFALFSNTSHSSIFRKLGEERRAQTKRPIGRGEWPVLRNFNFACILQAALQADDKAP
jgi:hypothetical protein